MLYHGNSDDSSVANGVVIAMNSSVFVCAPSSGLHRESFGTLRALDSRWRASLGLILGIMLFVFAALAEEPPAEFQMRILNCAETSSAVGGRRSDDVKATA